jgi:hypothetical protein
MRYSMPGWHRPGHHGKRVFMFAGLIGLVAYMLAGGEAQAPAPDSGVRVMTVEQRLIVRVPVSPRAIKRLRWEEREGPRCIPVRAIAGAHLAGENGVDFLLRNRQRVRARLDSDCAGLDFWDGFYMQPENQMICAGRDVIRSRVGGSCEIRRFHLLVPHLADR